MIDAKAIGSPRAWDLYQKIILKTIVNMMPKWRSIMVEIYVPEEN